MRGGTSCHLNSQWTNFIYANKNQPLFKDLSLAI